MGSKSNAFENQLMLHIFNNVAIADIGDIAGLPASSTVGSVYVRLYTNAVVVDDATIGTECAYTGYVAGGVAVARTGAGWTVTANSAANAATIAFAACSGGSESVTYFAIWKNNTDTADSERLFWGTLTTPLAVSVGITPQFTAGDIVVNED